MFDGAPGIVVTDATLHVARSTVRGGDGGEGEVGGLPIFGPGGSALSLSANSLATATSDVVAESGTDGLPTTTPVATALTFAALFQVPAQTYAGILGPSVLPSAAKFALPPRVLDGAGLALLAVPVPADPVRVGRTPLVQTFTIDGVGNVSASLPGHFAIR